MWTIKNKNQKMNTTIDVWKQLMGRCLETFDEELDAPCGVDSSLFVHVYILQKHYLYYKLLLFVFL